ncbi:hypothetical protein WJX72_006647 [[Myrmecia] bisecta]|uniref:Isopentenyl phosphate kinase n=1 Tax=[Myrmecia] bisecta TaxID=41462 RepID=A0AAW1QR99_9CHLO
MDTTTTKLSVKRLIKFGGAAVTDKGCFETLNEPVLIQTAKHLSEVLSGEGRSQAVIVHGAGSFGHFQASKAKVAHGGWDGEVVRQGFVNTRLSVTKLNHLVVSALAAEGIPAVALSPAGSWITANRQVVEDGVAAVRSLLHAGLVPVLHGDCVLDDKQGCTILSGDTIIRTLAAQLRPEYVVFLTNVTGVYDRSPDQPGAVLIRHIDVASDGTWMARLPGTSSPDMASASHDTTGGMAAKI